jgi:hypothetical protein
MVQLSFPLLLLFPFLLSFLLFPAAVLALFPAVALDIASFPSVVLALSLQGKRSLVAF